MVIVGCWVVDAVAVVVFAPAYPVDFLPSMLHVHILLFAGHVVFSNDSTCWEYVLNSSLTMIVFVPPPMAKSLDVHTPLAFTMVDPVMDFEGIFMVILPPGVPVPLMLGIVVFPDCWRGLRISCRTGIAAAREPQFQRRFLDERYTNAKTIPMIPREAMLNQDFRAIFGFLAMS